MISNMKSLNPLNLMDKNKISSKLGKIPSGLKK